MKKILCLVMCVLMMFGGCALAQQSDEGMPNLSGMSFDELVELRRQVILSMWANDEWNDAVLPVDIYKVGVDIPAGKWVLSPYYETALVSVHCFTQTDEYGIDPADSAEVRYRIAGNTYDLTELTSREYRGSVELELIEGTYIATFLSYVTFTPCEKPALQIENDAFAQFTLTELLALEEQIRMALKETDQWQETTLPLGAYQVGTDIEAGHWMFLPPDDESLPIVTWGTELDETGWFFDYENEILSETIMHPNHYSAVSRDNWHRSLDLTLIENTYIVVQRNEVVYTPYIGKPVPTFR